MIMEMLYLTTFSTHFIYGYIASENYDDGTEQNVPCIQNDGNKN